MALNPFIGWSQEDLEIELRSAQEDLAAGKTMISVGGGDISSSSLSQTSILQRIETLLAALSLLDPVTYPPGSVSRTDRTIARIV